MNEFLKLYGQPETGKLDPFRIVGHAVPLKIKHAQVGNAIE